MTRVAYDPNTFWGTIAKRVDRDYTKRFLFAGNCQFTLVNSDTNARITYRIRKPRSIKFHIFEPKMWKHFDYTQQQVIETPGRYCAKCWKPAEHPFHWVEPDSTSKYRVDLKINLDPTDNKGWEAIGWLESGPSNTPHFEFKYWQRSKVRADRVEIKTIGWFLGHLQADTLPDKLWVYHMGHCAKCGKKLDVPTSIECGFGPDCLEILQGKVA